MCCGWLPIPAAIALLLFCWGGGRVGGGQYRLRVRGCGGEYLSTKQLPHADSGSQFQPRNNCPYCTITALIVRSVQLGHSLSRVAERRVLYLRSANQNFLPDS